MTDRPHAPGIVLELPDDLFCKQCGLRWPCPTERAGREEGP